MSRRRPEDQKLCETSEKRERLFSDEEMLPMNLEIGRRLMEVFGNQAIANITFRLKSTSQEINDVLDGRSLPSCELLLGVKKMTGVSLDWLLTGQGARFGSDASERMIGEQISESEHRLLPPSRSDYPAIKRPSTPPGWARRVG